MDVWIWMAETVATFGYLGAFVICIVGNVSIIVPVPFALVVYAFGATLNPLLLGVVAGVGSTVGEMSSYLIGRGGRRVIENRYGARLDAIEKLMERYGALVVFLFALLPLPDDLLLIPLGMMKYDVKKTVIAMLLGKTLMCIFLAYAGAYSLSYFRDIFNSGGVFSEAASILLLGVIIVVMLKIDWGKLLEKSGTLG